MSFFGILRKGIDSDFVIDDCHINFWVLPQGLKGFFQQKFLLDVGLKVTAGKKNFSSMRIAVPFDSKEATRPECLSSLVLDKDIGPLIFGKPVEIIGNKVEYTDPGQPSNKLTLNVVKLELKSCIPEAENKEKNGFSTWTLHINQIINPGKSCYFRFRIPIHFPKRFWLSKGWGLAKKGNIVDLRISDVRESMLLNEGNEEVDQLVPIKRLFLFLACDANIVPKHASPNLYYSRILEPQVWSRYLKSIGNYNKDAKLAIHQWRNLDRNGNFIEVTKNTPFRAYADLSREFGIELLLLYSIAITLPYAIQLIKFIYASVSAFFV